MYSTLEKYKRDTHKRILLKEYKEAISRVEELRQRIEYEKECEECGQYFIAKAINQICCSPECSRRRDNRLRDKRNSKNGKADKSITLVKLYKRDNGICALCGEHINFDCDSNSNKYPSIDHIIPIAKGGLHEWSNVQLACRICNSIKADKYDEEIEDDTKYPLIKFLT
jgi:5-methylcytosine-specific restriction endonuclease McrA